MYLEYFWLFLLIFDSLFLFSAGNRGSTPPQQGGPTQEQIYAPVAHLQQKIQQRQLQQFHQVKKQAQQCTKLGNMQYIFCAILSSIIRNKFESSKIS